MSIWKLVRLKFGRNVAHFGELGIGLEETSERIHSDTLFSAWLSIYARFPSADIESLIEQFKQPVPPFRLSSTFIYQELNGQIIEYLPRPFRLPKNYPSGDDLEFAKTFKKLKYLPLSVWKRWYQEEGFDKEADRHELIAATQGQATGALAQAGTFDYSKAYKIQKLPKVAIDRTSRATNFYHTGFVTYRWEPLNGSINSLSGLYFLVEFPTADPTIEQTFFQVLSLLGDAGIGGERSSGAGQFEAEVMDCSPDWVNVTGFNDGTQHSLMSLFWQPQITPEMLTEASFELKERGGWITSPTADAPQRRQSVRMFTEGSVFGFRPGGALADVTPRQFRAHRVYRSGICLSLPIAV